MQPVVRITRALAFATAAALAACQMPPSEPLTPQPALVRYAAPHASVLAAAAIDAAAREALRLAREHNAQVELRERARP